MPPIGTKAGAESKPKVGADLAVDPSCFCCFLPPNSRQPIDAPINAPVNPDIPSNGINGKAKNPIAANASIPTTFPF